MMPPDCTCHDAAGDLQNCPRHQRKRPGYACNSWCELPPDHTEPCAMVHLKPTTEADRYNWPRGWCGGMYDRERLFRLAADVNRAEAEVKRLREELGEVGCRRFSRGGGNTCALNTLGIDWPRAKWCPVCRALQGGEHADKGGRDG